MSEDLKKPKRGKAADVFSEEERAAMREHVKEVRAQRSGGTKADGEADVRKAIAAMAERSRKIGERLHELITTAAPELTPRTWYGMPAYAKDGKVVCFFRGAEKFKERYVTFGFNDIAKLDEGVMWPIAFALQDLSPAGEAKVTELVKKAVS